MKSEYIIVRKKGVIVLPKEIRDKLDIKTGDALKIRIDEKRIILEKIDFWEKLFGSAKGQYDPDKAELELDLGETIEENIS